MKSCMIVDDSQVVRKFAKRIVEELGFSVIEASDGQEALLACEKQLPDVILLDWNMPNVDGLQFLKLFKKHTEWSQVVVIFCTTENEAPKIVEALQAGANEFIMKPFDLELVKDKFIQTGLIKV